jgi:hypothetical protein
VDVKLMWDKMVIATAEKMFWGTCSILFPFYSWPVHAVLVVGFLLLASESSVAASSGEEVALTSGNFPTPAPKAMKVVDARWIKSPLSEIKVTFHEQCPIAASTDGLISIREKGLEIEIMESDERIFLCSNYRGEYDILEYDELKRVFSILSQDAANLVMLAYATVRTRGVSFQTLTGFQVMEPSSFSGSYAIATDKGCRDQDREDRLLRVPLRLVSVSSIRCGRESTGVVIDIPKLPGTKENRFLLCTDQARTPLEKVKIQMDLAILKELGSEISERKLLIGYRANCGCSCTSKLGPRRVVAIDILPATDYASRVRARMLEEERFFPIIQGTAAKSVCVARSSMLVDEITCDAVSKLELMSRQLERKTRGKQGTKLYLPTPSGSEPQTRRIQAGSSQTRRSTF